MRSLVVLYLVLYVGACGEPAQMDPPGAKVPDSVALPVAPDSVAVVAWDEYEEERFRAAWNVVRADVEWEYHEGIFDENEELSEALVQDDDWVVRWLDILRPTEWGEFLEEGPLSMTDFRRIKQVIDAGGAGNLKGVGKSIVEREVTHGPIAWSGCVLNERRIEYNLAALKAMTVDAFRFMRLHEIGHHAQNHYPGCKAIEDDDFAEVEADCWAAWARA